MKCDSQELLSKLEFIKQPYYDLDNNFWRDGKYLLILNFQSWEITQYGVQNIALIATRMAFNLPKNQTTLPIDMYYFVEIA